MSTVRTFVESLVLVYTIMILAYIVMGMLPIPYSTTSARIREFLDQTVTPYLNVFRRFIPPVGMLDLSPMVAIFVLWTVPNIVLGLIGA